MTTPDTRTAADWSAESVAHRNISCDTLIDSRVVNPIDTSATATPDTSTTAGKIAVMQQAHDDGRNVQYRFRRKEMDWEFVGGRPLWDWDTTDYRIAQPPALRTALQRARDLRSRLDTVDSMAADGILCCLLADIDYAPVVEVLERLISWDAAALGALPKGRYRLVRDDQ